MKQFTIFFVTALFLFAIVSCNKEAHVVPVAKKAEKKVTLVKTREIVFLTFIQKLTLPAEAKASKEVIVASEIGGRVLTVNFKEGTYVKKGETLVRLDASSIEADITMAVADKNLAHLDYRKFTTLSQKKAAVSDFQVEQAKLRLDSAEARIVGLETILHKHTIKAPFSGVVVSREIETGAITTPGARLTKIIAIKPVKVVTGIPETAIANFGLGKTAEITFDSYPDKKYVGKITFIAPEVNRLTRVFECEILLPNTDQKIRPQMSAKVIFIKRKIKDSILIPQTAVLELTDGHAVFIVTKDNIAQKIKIKIEDSADEMALVIKGLAVGDTLVVSGQRELVDGDTVKAVLDSE